MTHRIGRTVAAALLAITLTTAPAWADDTTDGTAPTENPHGAEWGQPGDPLPEGMEHIDIDRQLEELAAKSTPADDGPVQTFEPAAPLHNPAPAQPQSAPAAVGDQSWTVETRAPSAPRAPRSDRPAPSLPSTGN